MKKFSTSDISRMALYAAALSVCAWIVIPAAVPFTLQTFAIVLFSAVLGAKKAIIATMVYILCGIVGLPVFSGFRGGAGVIISATGGYILGFVPFAAIVGYFSNKERKLSIIISALFGNFVCYAVGTLWYAIAFSEGKTVSAILSICVLPFIVPDIIKILMAAYCVKRIKNI